MKVLPGVWLAAVLVLAGGPAFALERSLELVAQAYALTPDPKRGAELFERDCSACHGQQAWGRADSAVPSLAGQRELYLLRQLADVAEQNRDIPEMHRLRILVNPESLQDWRDLAAWLSVQRVNPAPQHGDGKSLDLGSGIYRDACAQCHGDRGEGDDAIASPVLAGQHYSTLLLQIRRMAAGHRYANLDFDLALMLGALDATDMAAVADYISRLPDSSP
jgi:cytochrome c553